MPENYVRAGRTMNIERINACCNDSGTYIHREHMRMIIQTNVHGK